LLQLGRRLLGQRLLGAVFLLWWTDFWAEHSELMPHLLHLPSAWQVCLQLGYRARQARQAGCGAQGAHNWALHHLGISTSVTSNRMDLAEPSMVDHKVAIAREENAVAFVEDSGVMRLGTFRTKYVCSSDGRSVLAEDSAVRKT
jgi:hypothetical protein